MKGSDCELVAVLTLNMTLAICEGEGRGSIMKSVCHRLGAIYTKEHWHTGCHVKLDRGVDGRDLTFGFAWSDEEVPEIAGSVDVAFKEVLK